VVGVGSGSGSGSVWVLGRAGRGRADGQGGRESSPLEQKVNIAGRNKR
jgi:hypothetical protein